MKKTNLYILVFQKNRAIKIGKANDISSRMISLKKWWGEPDYEESYSLEICIDDVFTLEKSLHLILSSYSLDYSVGDGKTEMFSLDSLDYAIKHIELYIEHSYNEGVLKKGVKALRQGHKSMNGKRDNVLSKYTGKQKNLSNTMNDAGSNLKDIMRVVSILIKSRHRMKYQYSLEKNLMTFVVSHERLSNNLNLDAISKMFRFRVVDFSGGYIGVNFLSSISKSDECLQFVIRINCGNENCLIRYFSEQISHILLTLPKKSPALSQNISLLDRF
ncbi:GIY-YIG nuclease family protein [Desulfotalea psychrophila]|nr:GIY-YIG nuclease family protein [Desulfotalea psychrophila]